VSLRKFKRSYIDGNRTFNIVVGDYPDLTPDISSIRVEKASDPANYNISFTLVNKGNANASNFSVCWNWTTGNYTYTNLSLPAGARMEIKREVNMSGVLSVKIDPENTLLE